MTYVDHIPGVALSLEVSSHIGNVRLDYGCQGLAAPLAVSDCTGSLRQLPYCTATSNPSGCRGQAGQHTPSGKLRVPHERVAAHKLAIGLGEPGNAVASGKAELVAVRLSRVPFLYPAACVLVLKPWAFLKAGWHVRSLPGVIWPNSLEFFK